MEQFDIAICGYGPVGSTFAGLMGKLGHKVLVIEKNSGPSPTARAINTDGEQLRTFDRLGIAEKVVENSVNGIILLISEFKCTVLFLII